MATMVVREVQENGRTLWAWSRVEHGAGFSEVTYTLPDGVTPVVDEHLDVAPRGPVLFSAPVADLCPPADQDRLTFSFIMPRGTTPAEAHQEALRLLPSNAASFRVNLGSTSRWKPYPVVSVEATLTYMNPEHHEHRPL